MFDILNTIQKRVISDPRDLRLTVGTHQNRLSEAFLARSHSLCFGSKIGTLGIQGHVFVMAHIDVTDNSYFISEPPRGKTNNVVSEQV